MGLVRRLTLGVSAGASVAVDDVYRDPLAAGAA
jgi:hypothetical protein